MSDVVSFADFLPQFFGLFSSKSFRGSEYLTYLNRPTAQRSGDEAPVVDMAIVAPLLGLLGFEPAERVYNQQRQYGRPDFAPRDALYGTCFIVEDKNTALPLSCDLSDPDSHLSQLVGYMRATSVRLGWLTNGRQLMLWKFDERNQPVCIIDIDLPALIQEWRENESASLSSSSEKQLHDLFDLCHKTTFTDPERLEKELAVSLEEWQQLALPLGKGSGNETLLVEAVQSLVRDLQGDARRKLNEHLARYHEYAEKSSRLTDDSLEVVSEEFGKLRSRIISILTDRFQLIWGLEDGDIAAIERILLALEQETKLFASPRELFQQILDVINAARQRKYEARTKEGRPLANLDDLPILKNPLQVYIEKGFAWHQRQATLRHDYQQDMRVYDDYTTWRSLVQETMLGELDEERRRDEFALQAAYVVFIRLLLIRVCEDKGVFPHRFISDGGLKRWQEDIERYFIFATGNPYSPLLEIAYNNAQNIYAHFFTGRELFNWYQLDRSRFIMTLYQLSRFNFTDVDSDIIGTIYNTYVNREEKRNKGQYYTPPAIINYILDNIGYTGTNVIGSSKRLIDPACGSGSFLVTAAKRLIAAYQGPGGKVDDPVAVLERVQQNLFGFDLNPFACYLAEMNLLIQTLDLVKQAHAVKKDLKLQSFHIYNVDALARPSGVYYYMNFNTLLAEENDQVNKIKSRAQDTPYAQGFAFVVANPPYGARLSDEYKQMLRDNWSDVFYGQPDTYTFFLKLGLDLLSTSGRLGFITPNTYLKGVNTALLRGKLLSSARIEQIVDLPQGIWPDANVDCVLLFLRPETDEQSRRSQQVQVHLLGLRDTLEKLTERAWAETLTQPQANWMNDSRFEMTIRHDALLQQVEDACRVPFNGTTKVLRLGDVTDSSQGIIVYETRAESRANLYIKPRRDVPLSQQDWKPLLDGTAYIGRYELHWGKERPYLKYGEWLCRPREAKYFELPKLLLVRLRNKALKRRLVATYDDAQFFNRDNFNNIITKDKAYALKYLLSLFNSSLLNYWYSRDFDNVNINPDSFQQLPIYPASPDIQATFVKLVDDILARHAALNTFRTQGYGIRHTHTGWPVIEVPYHALLAEIQRTDRNFPVLTLYDARSLGLFRIPDRCDMQATVGSNVYIPDKYPDSLVLRHNKLWLEAPDAAVRRYLHGYLSRPQWQGKTWDEIKNTALIPEDAVALNIFFAAVARKIEEITLLLEEIRHIDMEIDERVLDLYSITNPVDRQRVLGSAPLDEDEGENGDEEE